MSNERHQRHNQREAARSKAKAIREAQKKSLGRKRVFVVVASVFASVGLVLSVAFALQQQPATSVVGPSTAIFDGGIRVGEGLQVITDKSSASNAVPNIVIYEDLQCAGCKVFSVPNMAQIRELVTSGSYTVEIHVISYLDGKSVNVYSSRAANALLCVAEKSPRNFFDYNEALFTNQPDATTAGPSNEELAVLASKVGVNEPSAIDCIKKPIFSTWAKNIGSSVWNQKVPGTNIEFTDPPFIHVNGDQYLGDYANAAMFLQWLQTTAPVN